MNILTVNPGSTAIKYSFFSSQNKDREDKVFERLDGKKISESEIRWLTEVLKKTDRIGIRVVHPGEYVRKHKLISDSVLFSIKEAIEYAPIHNALAIDTIQLFDNFLFDNPIVAVFDTVFHKNLLPQAYTYPISNEIPNMNKYRRFGFHGIALESVYGQIKNPPAKIIMAHLGGGTSITAVFNGQSIDTTMGFTPLEGPMMVTRSGSIDPDLFKIIMKEAKIKSNELSNILNNKSGFFGITGQKDIEQIIKNALSGDKKAKLATDIYLYQVIKHIYAMAGVLQGVDMLTISGGIGFGNKFIQERVLTFTKSLGITKDKLFITKADEAFVIKKATEEIKL